MSNVVYSTEINKDIRKAYKTFLTLLGKDPQGKVKTNAAFCIFADACEKDNKLPIKVAEELRNEE